MDMVFKNNKIIATVIFLTFNIVCILFYFFGIFNDLSDSFYHKFCEFLYILNFALIPFLFYIYRVKIFSPQGLFYISSCLFALGRVFLSFFGLYRDYYELYWGQLFYFNNLDFFESLIFWQLSLSSFILGSLIFSTRLEFNIQLSNLNYKKTFYILNFLSATILFILWFPISYEMISMFMVAGYEGLYTGQADYSFGAQRIASLLLPIMVASGVLCNNKRGLYFSLFILFLYILVNLLVGQRVLLFVWILICLWMYNLITKRDLPFLKISLLGLSLMIFAQFLESFRGGRGDFDLENPLTKFIYVQSLTYMLPSIVNSLDTEWPTLAYVTMFFPVAGLFSSLGLVIGSQNYNSGAFFAYTLNSSLFDNGFGLGWSVFLDLYILSGRNYLLLSFFSFIFGLIFCYLIEKSKKNLIFFVYFIRIAVKPRGLARGYKAAIR
ncbi:O-antigen polysaccharide polymerase Wzy family protein [Acinetobacter baumannii]|uniref:O-antigen polysaccharide polymerase Wzy family protein n=2 Tax=Acinetobacter TaxID=469 RepID=UPI0021D06415|nr:O-antigen polysaccharide polymerase Wzy family protein [Acinetobacter ursingii]MDC5039899.1 O-antigen polysaccharide polymerase Wzy family protein [Acinetobacter baumannii]MDN8239614.1 O-antigen polysaccharide polymerase Wzy family protein [Acinetobacter baumannii]